ncbi:MAG: hypothetical protein ACUVTR_07485 [Dehalococcoidia bacterium]
MIESRGEASSMTGLARLLNLQPDDEGRLNPHALERINAWEARILRRTRQLDLEEVIADLDTYLRRNERVEFDKCLADIKKWLSGCIDSASKYFLHPYATWVIDPMLRVESLIVRAYQRAEADRRKKEHEDRWCAAFVSVRPPVDDAKKHLNDNEHKEFTLAVEKAIDAYLEKGEGYMADPRALEYGRWLKTIEQRKQQEALEQ